MPESLEHIVAGITGSPQRSDLLAGFIALCRTDKNPIRQAEALVSCAKAILSTQPLLALKLLQVALGVAPKHPAALGMAKQIFNRRGRWSAEQRIAELMSTQTQASALTPLSEDLRASVVETVTKEPALPEPLPAFEDVAVQLSEIESLPKDESVSVQQDRVEEYLKRCGFEVGWAHLASGFSRNNAGLTAFVGMLVGLNMIKVDERTLAGIMLLKMINEKPDDSGAQEILERLFPDLVSANREGK